MDAGHEEAGHGKQADDLVADERHVEVAGARAVGIERGAVLPPLAGHRAAAQHDAGARRDLLTEDAQELVEPLLVAAKRQPEDVRPPLCLAQFARVHMLSSTRCPS